MEESLSRTVFYPEALVNSSATRDDAYKTYLLLGARITFIAGVKRRNGNIALSACADGARLVGKVAAIVACHNILKYVVMGVFTEVGRIETYSAKRPPVYASQDKLEVADFSACRGDSWEVDILEGCYRH